MTTMKSMGTPKPISYLDVVERLFGISMATNLPLPERVANLLELGLETFGLDLAIVSHISGADYTIEFSAVRGDSAAPAAGTHFPLGQTYCCHTLAASEPTGFHHVAASTIATHPCYQTFKLEAYLGCPLTVNGRLFGTLNFSAASPRAPFSAEELSLIRMFGQWLENNLGQHRNNKRLDYFLSLSPSVTYSLSLENEVTRPVWVSGNIKSALGYEIEEVMQPSWWAQHVVSEDLATAFENFSRIIERGEGSHEYRFIKANGEVIWVLDQIKVIPSGISQGMEVIGNWMDITARKNMETLKNEFIAVVSHELRTPITSIMGSLGLLLSQPVENLHSNQAQLLEVCHRNSQRLAILVNDILDVEKLEFGKMDFSTENISSRHLLDDAVSDNVGLAESREVHLVKDADNEELVIKGDRSRLLQVLNNLISNAVKFSPAGGEIMLSCRKEGEFLRLSVSDQGPGIPESFWPRVFDKFSQADSSDSRQNVGSGLGLSISRAIVEKHNGRIDFVTDSNTGTSFSVWLPLARETDRNIEPRHCRTGS